MSASWVETDRSLPAPGVRNAMERDGMNQTGMRPKPYKSAGRNRKKNLEPVLRSFKREP